MTQTDLLVVGAGPAGLAAAAEAARTGVKVLVVDDNLRAGGQIYRQVPVEFKAGTSAAASTDVGRGKALLSEATSAGVQFRFGCTAWGMFEPGTIEVADDAGLDRIRAACIVIAAGAHDRPTPLPGWTLPGVFTVGGAQALLKGQRILPGRRMLLAGVGPLLLVVASQLSQAGVDVVAVAEPVPFWRGATVLPALVRVWPLLKDAVRYRTTLLRKRVPWFSRTILTKVEGKATVTGATVARVDSNWRPVAGTDQHFDVDAVAIGYGLVPSIELARLCGCEMTYDARVRSWTPRRNAQFESSVPGLFLVGDGAGVAGAVVATEEGRVAGVAVARQLGRLTNAAANHQSAPSLRRLAALQRFRQAVDHAFALHDGLFELADAQTIACRCEEVTFDDLEEAALDGASTPAVLKSFTRCGMGPCQGRMCSTTTAEWLSRRTGIPMALHPLPTVAPPVKPVVTLGALAAD